MQPTLLLRQKDLRACLHGRRVTLLEGLPSLEGQKIALLYMCRVIPGAVLPAKGAETWNHHADQLRTSKFVYVVEKHLSGFGRPCSFLCLFGWRLVSWFIITCVYIFQWLTPCGESFRSRPSPFTRTISPEWSIPASKLILLSSSSFWFNLASIGRRNNSPGL